MLLLLLLYQSHRFTANCGGPVASKFSFLRLGATGPHSNCTPQMSRENLPHDHSIFNSELTEIISLL